MFKGYQEVVQEHFAMHDKMLRLGENCAFNNLKDDNGEFTLEDYDCYLYYFHTRHYAYDQKSFSEVKYVKHLIIPTHFYNSNQFFIIKKLHLLKHIKVTMTKDIDKLQCLNNLETLELELILPCDISSLVNLNNLKRLYFWACHRPENFLSLKALKNLEFLEINQSDIPLEQIEELQNHLPNCEIIY